MQNYARRCEVLQFRCNFSLPTQKPLSFRAIKNKNFTAIPEYKAKILFDEYMNVLSQKERFTPLCTTEELMV